MSHLFESGFTVREASWHGLEDVIPEDVAKAMTWDDGRRAAGLMWEPVFEPLYRVSIEATGTPLYRQAEDGTFVIEPAARVVDEVSSSRLAIRDDTRAELGPVSGTFEFITHEEMGRIMEPVLSQPGVRLDTMGVLDEGRDVYATVLLDEPYEIKGDVDGFGDPVVTLPYFAILNNHVGAGACKGLYTQVRVVCKNTVQASAADGDRHGAQFVLRHTSGVKARIDDARDVVAGCRAEAAKWREMAEALALLPITDEQQEEFAERFIAMPPVSQITDRVKANVDKERGLFLTTLRESATNCGMQHNALGLFNAAVEYSDWIRKAQSKDTLIRRHIMRAEPLKAGALAIVRDLAGVSS